MSLFGNVNQETKFLQIGAPGEDLLARAHLLFQECMIESKKNVDDVKKGIHLLLPLTL